MHIGIVRGGTTTFRQILVRFPTAPTSNTWWQIYQRRISRVSGLDDLATAYRLNVRTNGAIERTCSAVFEPRSEPAARQFFGGMNMLEAYAPDSFDFPDNAAQFEKAAADFPRLRCMVLPTRLQSGDVWLTCDFRVGSHLDTLVGEAQAFGFAFGYQVHFRHYTPSPEQQRRIGRNVIALQSVGQAPTELVMDQERQARRFRSATLLVEEMVAVDGDDAARWLNSALVRLYRAGPVGARLDPIGFEFRTGIDCALMMHSTLLYGEWTEDDLICSQSDQESFRAAILGYRPPADAVARSGTATEPDREPPPSPWPINVALPPPYNGPGHIFVSYKRTDLPRILGILQRLTDGGLPIWYDRGNTAGDEWDVALEQKIHEASMMLFFMSQSAVDSKYCKREDSARRYCRKADPDRRPRKCEVAVWFEVPLVGSGGQCGRP